MPLSPEDDRHVAKNTKLVSVDILISDRYGRLLMGKTAKGYWFVPGGRIEKGQTIGQALRKISKEKVSFDASEMPGMFIGPYDHIYQSSNVDDVSDIDIEYVAFAYYVSLQDTTHQFNLEDLPREQYSQWQWLDNRADIEIHENTRLYFQAIYCLSCDRAAYDALNHRRDSFNQLLWQAPSISLVAQSFLFVIILDPDTASLSRRIAAGLALVISVASLQLLSKHRFNEKRLAIELESIEHLSRRYFVNRHAKPESFLTGLSSYQLWSIMLSLFGFAAALVLIIDQVMPELLNP